MRRKEIRKAWSISQEGRISKIANHVLDAIKYPHGKIVLKGISRVFHAAKKDIRKKTVPRIKRHLRLKIEWGLHVCRAISLFITRLNVQKTKDRTTWEGKHGTRTSYWTSLLPDKKR